MFLSRAHGHPGERGHLRIAQGEAVDLEIGSDVAEVVRGRDRDDAALHHPTQRDLCRGDIVRLGHGDHGGLG